MFPSNDVQNPVRVTYLRCTPLSLSLWHVFQILIMLTKAMFECSLKARFSDSKKAVNESMLLGKV